MLERGSIVDRRLPSAAVELVNWPTSGRGRRCRVPDVVATILEGCVFHLVRTAGIVEAKVSTGRPRRRRTRRHRTRRWAGVAALCLHAVVAILTFRNV